MNQVFDGIIGQQVSLFSVDQSIKITTAGLKYPLQNEALPTLYAGTLNAMVDDQFSVNISHGKILAYCAF